MLDFAMDRRLSLDARGALSYLIAAGLQTFSLEHLTHDGAGAGRDRAYRILGELRATEYVKRSANGYTFVNLSWFSRNPETPEIAQHIDHDLDTSSRSVVRGSWFTENQERLKLSHNSDDGPEPDAGEMSQTSLIGLPEPPPPVAPPPSPTKPKRDRTPKRTAADVACDEALAEVLGVNLAAIDRTLRLAVYAKRKSLQKAGATPETIRAVAAYWRSPANPIAQRAARERRPVSAPSLEQIGRCYQQAQDWQAAEDARRQRAAPSRPPETPPTSEAETPSPRELFRRTFGLSSSPRPAMVAAGRAT